MSENNIKINTVQNANEPYSINCENKKDENESIFPDNSCVNGVIEDFAQGEIGDCTLLSALIGVKNSASGSEIFKNAITEKDESYSVYFKGLNKSFEISKDELENALKEGYATGINDKGKADCDVVLLELAFEKLCTEKPSKRKQFKILMKGEEQYQNKLSIESEDSSYFIKMLTGHHVSTHENWLNSGIGNNFILNKFIGKDFIACANFSADSGDIKVMVNNEEYLICPEGCGHSYSIKSVDKTNVVLINPHNSSEEITISRKEFSKIVDEIQYCVFG